MQNEVKGNMFQVKEQGKTTEEELREADRESTWERFQGSDGNSDQRT